MDKLIWKQALTWASTILVDQLVFTIEKTIDCLTFCSESGGITAEILVKVFKYSDNKEVFSRVSSGPIPMILVDDHQSQLYLKFIVEGMFGCVLCHKHWAGLRLCST